MALTVHVGKDEYEFTGPLSETTELKSQSGTYVVTTKTKDGKHKVLDVGESADVEDRVSHHDRADEWPKEELDGVFYSGYYCDEKERMRIADAIRAEHRPPCGKQ
jgi:hypothetical protein